MAVELCMQDHPNLRNRIEQEWSRLPAFCLGYATQQKGLTMHQNLWHQDRNLFSLALYFNSFTRTIKFYLANTPILMLRGRMHTCAGNITRDASSVSIFFIP